VSGDGRGRWAVDPAAIELPPTEQIDMTPYLADLLQRPIR
jgi:hypothetical protein